VKNIEYKAELLNLETARGIARAIGAREVAFLEQTDEYFPVAEGRLKRRTERNATQGTERREWIWYDRADKVQARTSRWTRLDDRQVEVRWPNLVRKVEHYIKKRRELWDFEGVRIHLDSVAGLGNFLEFEGVVDSSGDPTRVRGTVEHLIGQFRPVLGEPVSGSYADM
jgi:adenylate cyclase class IV